MEGIISQFTVNLKNIHTYCWKDFPNTNYKIYEHITFPQVQLISITRITNTFNLTVIYDPFVKAGLVHWGGLCSLV